MVTTPLVQTVGAYFESQRRQGSMGSASTLEPAVHSTCGGEAARGEMVEADAVLEVSDSILNLGVAAMVGLQFQGSYPSRSVMKP